MKIQAPSEEMFSTKDCLLVTPIGLLMIIIPMMNEYELAESDSPTKYRTIGNSSH